MHEEIEDLLIPYRIFIPDVSVGSLNQIKSLINMTPNSSEELVDEVTLNSELEKAWVTYSMRNSLLHPIL